MAKSSAETKKGATKKAAAAAGGAKKAPAGGVKKNAAKKEPGTGRRVSNYHIKPPAINKMIRAGGNPAVSKKVMGPARDTLNLIIDSIMHNARISVENERRKTYQLGDAKYAVEKSTGMRVVSTTNK